MDKAKITKLMINDNTFVISSIHWNFYSPEATQLFNNGSSFSHSYYWKNISDTFFLRFFHIHFSNGRHRSLPGQTIPRSFLSLSALRGRKTIGSFPADIHAVSHLKNVSIVQLDGSVRFSKPSFIHSFFLHFLFIRNFTCGKEIQ